MKPLYETEKNEEKNKLEISIKLEKQATILTDLYDIIYKHIDDKKPYIAINDWYEFALKNKELFLEYTILSLKNLLIEENNNKFNPLLELFKNPNFIIFIEAFKNKLQNENIEQISSDVSDSIKEYWKEVEKILKYYKVSQLENQRLNKENILIKQGNKNLQDQLILLWDKQEEINWLLDLYWINDIDWLIEYFNYSEKTGKSHNALFLFLKSLEKQWIIISVNNWKWKKNPSIITKKSTIIENKSEYKKDTISKSSILKAWTTNVKAYKYDELWKKQSKIKDKTKKLSETEENLKLKKETEELRKEIKQLENENSKKDLKIQKLETEILETENEISEALENNSEIQKKLEESWDKSLDKSTSQSVFYKEWDHAYKKSSN